MKYIHDINEFEEKRKRVEKLLFLSNFFTSKKIILTSLEEMAEAGKLLLVSILKHSHTMGDIILTSNSKENMQILKTIVAKEWDIIDEVEEILELMELNKKHKKSPIEFMRNKKVVILDEDQNIEIINSVKLKKFLISIKTIRKSFQEKTKTYRSNSKF